MKIVIHIHLFYIEMYNEIRAYVKNLPSNKADIFYTLSAENAHIQQKIKKDYAKYNVKILIVKNIGFDIYPFLCFLNIINLQDYDLIIKLHSKKKIPMEYKLNGYNLSGNAFRKYLFTAILGTKQRVEDIINIFSSQREVGMIGADELIIRDGNIDQDIDMHKVNIVVRECNQNITKREFIAGTVFVARASLFQSIKDRNYQLEDFPKAYPRDWNSLPYCLERYFGLMVSSQGYKLIGMTTTTNKWIIATQDYISTKKYLIKRFHAKCRYVAAQKNCVEIVFKKFKRLILGN